MVKISNWGNYPVTESTIRPFTSLSGLKSIFNETDSIIARGLGRCYGDSSLHSEIAAAHKFNRILDFDTERGIITCESGISLADLLDIIVPRGFFLPVTPGTKFVTLGGAVASDVHGKNHHVSGSISSHIQSLKILTENGLELQCSPDDNADLFSATCGGMGLTGIIIEVTMKLAPVETSFIRQHVQRARDLREITELFDQHATSTYSVAWIDCLARGKNLGRSVLITGEHAKLIDLKDLFEDRIPLNPGKNKTSSVPFNFPGFALNPLTVKAFNELYYRKAPVKSKESITGYNSFFYPLDNVLNWNRIYGKRGFLQYQFVLPKAESEKGMRKILKMISDSGQGSFLAVLKMFGKQESILSFPMEGMTIALDFPVSRGIFTFLDKLDEIVAEMGGRIYLTKDARMKAEIFRKGYPRLDEFKNILDNYSPERKFRSRQSIRLEI